MTEAIAELWRHEEHARDVTTITPGRAPTKADSNHQACRGRWRDCCVVLTLKGLVPDDFEAEVAAGTEGDVHQRRLGAVTRSM